MDRERKTSLRKAERQERRVRERPKALVDIYPNPRSARTAALFFTDPDLRCNLHISDHTAM